MAADWKIKLWDRAAAFPMIAWFSMVAYASLSELAGATDWLSAPFERATQLATAFFAAILVVFFLVRRVPVARQTDWRAVAAGIVGGFAPMSIVLLPSAALPPWLKLASTFLTFLGTLASIGVVIWLGRSFSILPQARRLVTGGPYRLVRHPLYLAEMATLFGLMWQYRQPWAALAWAFAVAAQFPRMHFEEQVLAATFPSYRDYAKRTRRLLPGLF